MENGNLAPSQDAVRAWHAQGKKALGVICCHVPPELLHALDILPVRLRATGCADAVIASSEYGVRVPGMVARANVCGCQFHPEKSGKVGLTVLKAFCDM